MKLTTTQLWSHSVLPSSVCQDTPNPPRCPTIVNTHRCMRNKRMALLLDAHHPHQHHHHPGAIITRSLRSIGIALAGPNTSDIRAQVDVVGRGQTAKRQHTDTHTHETRSTHITCKMSEAARRQHTQRQRRPPTVQEPATCQSTPPQLLRLQQQRLLLHKRLKQLQQQKARELPADGALPSTAAAA